MKKIYPLGFLIWLYLLIFAGSVALFVMKYIVEQGSIFYGLAIFIAAYCLYWLIRNFFSYPIFYDEKSIWMNKDFVLIRNERIQYETTIEFDNIVSYTIEETFGNSLGRSLGRKGMKRFLVCVGKDEVTRRLYISVLFPSQVNRILRLLKQKTGKDITIPKRS